MNNRLIRKINFIVSRYTVYTALIRGREHIPIPFKELKVMQYNSMVVPESLTYMLSDNIRVLTNALIKP
jgi:hypothetical protein